MKLYTYFPFLSDYSHQGNVTAEAEEGVQATTKRSLATMNTALRLGTACG